MGSRSFPPCTARWSQLDDGAGSLSQSDVDLREQHREDYARSVYAWLPPGVELLTDTSGGDWIASRLRPWRKDGLRVESFMPPEFAGYARILHPAGGRGGNHQGLPWSEVASRLSRQFHPDVQFSHLVDGEIYEHPALGDVTPSSGSLPLSVLRSLVTFLEGWTASDEPCWFAMWDGNGTWWQGAHGGDGRFDDERDAVLTRTPRLHTEARRYFLMRGVLVDVVPLYDAAAGQSPALWWPDDHSWLVSTEVDAFSTYVGGSEDLIAALLANSEIEAVPTHLEAQLDWGL